MKTKIAVVLAILNIGVLTNYSQIPRSGQYSRGPVPTGGNPVNGSSGNALAQQQAAYAAAEYEREQEAQFTASQQQALARIYSKDPWRKIGDSTNLAYGNGWVGFQGTVIEARADGVFFRGAWGKVLTLETSSDAEGHVNYGNDIFFVEAFPYPSTEGNWYRRQRFFRSVQSGILRLVITAKNLRGSYELTQTPQK
jgi:hypothetical protein